MRLCIDLHRRVKSGSRRNNGMKLVNLTAHDIVLCNSLGQTNLTLPPSGKVARVECYAPFIEEILVEGELVAVHKPRYGAALDLPGPVRDVGLVVSAMVRETEQEYRWFIYDTGEKYPLYCGFVGTEQDAISMALTMSTDTDGRRIKSFVPTRANDLYSPGELVRDEKGRIIGCKNLYRM